MEGTQTSGKVFFYANFPHSTYFQKNKDVPKESVYVFCETIYTKSDPNPDSETVAKEALMKKLSKEWRYRK